MSKSIKKHIEFEDLSELFLDQLDFKIRSVLLLFSIPHGIKKKVMKNLDKIELLVKENLTLIKYD